MANPNLPLIPVIQLTDDATDLPVWVNADQIVNFKQAEDGRSTMLFTAGDPPLGVTQTPAQILALLGY